MWQQLKKLITAGVVLSVIALTLPQPTSANGGGPVAETFYVSNQVIVTGGSCDDPDYEYVFANGLWAVLQGIYSDPDFGDGDTIVLCDNGSGTDYRLKENVASEDITNEEISIKGETGEEIVIDGENRDLFTFTGAGTLNVENLIIYDVAQAIDVVGDVTIAGSEISSASSNADGGAVRATGSVDVTDSTFHEQ